MKSFTLACAVLSLALLFAGPISAQSDDDDSPAASTLDSARTHPNYDRANRAKRARRATHGKHDLPPRDRQDSVVTFLLPAPTGLRSTTNLPDCSTHGGFAGGIACTAVLPKGQLVLVWDWSGAAKLDGYRIYRVDGGRNTAVGTQAPGKEITMFVVPPPSDGYVGKCYAATAYQGDEESDKSNVFCTEGGSLVQTITLTPTHMKSVERSLLYTTGFTGAVTDDNSVETSVPTAPVVAGYFYATHKVPAGDYANNGIYRAGLYFDVSVVDRKSIRAAHLLLRVDLAKIGGPDEYANASSPGPVVDHSTSCVGRIGYGTAYWWNYDDWIDAAVAVEPGFATGPDVRIDVTPLVRDWANGRPNYGMVLLGEDENLNAFTEKACETIYVPANTKLEIEYQ